VLPLLHGKDGEDGAIQGLLELSGIAYAGCDVQSSALCMDKSLAYIVARSAGIATPNFWTVTPDEDIDADQLTYPVFVKPARSGSSFGVTKVSRSEELQSAAVDEVAARSSDGGAGGQLHLLSGLAQHPDLAEIVDWPPLLALAVELLSQ
jgi:D-alanine--(R)-lactate ligase